MRQRFGENKVGKIAMGVLGVALVACLVYSAATEERQYSAYTPSVGLAQRKVMQGDIQKMEMQLAAKEVRTSCIGTAVAPRGTRTRAREIHSLRPRLLAARRRASGLRVARRGRN